MLLLITQITLNIAGQNPALILTNSVTRIICHCERSEAISYVACIQTDRFVTAFLAMTAMQLEIENTFK
ncbi:MAG: hypothetical protein HN356_14300 [Calditrichaeota bacterium]|nr:hypothetical protein [Calditrichota bacterium]MBT7789653.1 hypothetical protein [Calditrichota bacterium]